jgi:hypothetical protein
MKRQHVETTDGGSVEILIPENAIEAAALAQHGDPPSFAATDPDVVRAPQTPGGPPATPQAPRT